ncbi:MAG: hypothetical protein IJT69_05030 [Clostridia bacterium]|nr:hypothetical protein [Clostridia bacterium]
MIKEFSNETISEINYYVYRLIDPRNGQTFYVGKGKGNRVFDHVKCSIDYYDGVEETSDKDPNKFRIIKEIIDSGLDVIHIIQRWNLTEKEAFEVEAALIDAYQGLSNLQSGHHSDFGVTNAELLEKRFHLSEYKEPQDFKYIIIKVKSWKLDEMLEQYPETYRYEATRSAWRMNPRTVKEFPYVFSVTDGIVKEVYKVYNWYQHESRTGRFAFNGEIAHEEIRSRFVNKRIPDKYAKKGMASPVLFSKN